MCICVGYLFWYEIDGRDVVFLLVFSANIGVANYSERGLIWPLFWDASDRA